MPEGKSFLCIIAE